VVAHALAVIIWNILATGEPYHELGAGYFTRRVDPERETAGSSPSSKPSDTPSPFSQPPDRPARQTPATPPARVRCRLPSWGSFTY
jgi:hypothetical protein